MKIQLSGKDLIQLAEVSKRAGTEANFVDIAVEWISVAHVELDRLANRVKELESAADSSKAKAPDYVAETSPEIPDLRSLKEVFIPGSGLDGFSSEEDCLIVVYADSSTENSEVSAVLCYYEASRKQFCVLSVYTAFFLTDPSSASIGWDNCDASDIRHLEECISENRKNGFLTKKDILGLIQTVSVPIESSS
jgi:hypothetical protein